MPKLALLGGSPVLSKPLKPYKSLGKEEIKAVGKVVASGCLSGFYGSWGDAYFGGPKVKEFEEAWAKKFKVKHAVSVNSATSALFAAMGAIGIKPGDEVIVPPYTMSATVMAPLIYGGIPVFVDIEDQTFCLDPKLVRKAITKKTKAILVVNLFGHPASLHELRSIAREHKLKLIEDSSQAPLAMEKGRYAGTIGDIGIFSLNYHKHIHTGEGGMCVTNDNDLAIRLKLIRNHGENVVEPLKIKDITNLIGYNYRLTELSAAVGIEQLKKVENHVSCREKLANKLSAGIQGLDGLTSPKIKKGCRHVSYIWALRVQEKILGVSRKVFSEALLAEGFPHFVGYVKPLYLLPLFQKRECFGKYPFNLTTRKYTKGMCPVVERLHEKEFIGFETCARDVSSSETDLLIEAIHKVYEHRKELLSHR